MDKFYLDNAALYQRLLKEHNTKVASQTPKAVTPKISETCNPNMIVAARIRPLAEEDVVAGFPNAMFPLTGGTGGLDVHDLYNHPRGRPVLKSSKYQVDRLFDMNTTTEHIYQNLVLDLVPFAWNGGIGTLFTYGQTGSGKTYTVSRMEQLVAESLFDGTIEDHREIYITIIDLAGSNAFDLLQSRKPIMILEDSFGVTQLAGANEHLVTSKEEMMELVDRATTFRKTATTFKNDASSRSHAICRVTIKDTVNNTEGLLNLIDLAGSEAARDIANHNASLMAETRLINKSLSVLKDCIRGKAEADILKSSSSLSSNSSKPKKIPRIPYRQSTLTKVLKHVFEPTSIESCKTIVIACLNPSLPDVGPSRKTLAYAEMLRVPVPVGGEKEVDLTAPMTWDNAQLREWIAKNSGTPPISATMLAPKETGAQILRLPESEFQRRCLKTYIDPPVTVEQAEAFRSKLWQLHIDSQKGVDDASPSRMSSRDIQGPEAAKIPFKERIRPGIVISWREPDDDGLKMAVILSRTEATQNDEDDVKEASPRYICAQLVQGAMKGSWELNLWHQFVIDVGMMEKEVYLEYDAASRYYYISV